MTTKPIYSISWLNKLDRCHHLIIMVIVTKEENALSNHTISLEGVCPCSREEAVARIFVHPAQEGSKSLLVKASDTDIHIKPISVISTLQAIGLPQLWIAFLSRPRYEVDSCT